MIFDDFTQGDSTTTRKYGGTGLGLGISRRLVERMGGLLSVNSRLGKGSIFHFALSFRAASSVNGGANLLQLGTGVIAGEARNETPLKILLADDSADNRLLIHCYLKGSAHLLTFAEDGQQAVAQFQAGGFDVILMDVQMPRMDGLDATRAIREIEGLKGSARIPIIALTANARAEDVKLSNEAGCDAHLSKPISKERLLRALAEYGPGEPDPIIQIPEGLEGLVSGYLSSRNQDLKDLSLYALAGEFGRVRSIAHNIKGTGTSYGFPGLTELGAAIVESAEAADTKAMTIEIANLAKYLAKIPLMLTKRVETAPS
jgi:CheY-like chemotaxis protein